MRKYQTIPKEKKAEIISAYLTGDNSYEELAEYYKVNPSTIRGWISRYRKRKNVVSLQACQPFQEKDNIFSKGVNESSKVSTCSVKRLSTTSGKKTKTVNQNQEKTLAGVAVVPLCRCIWFLKFGTWEINEVA